MKTMFFKAILFCHILLICTYLGCGAPLRNDLDPVDQSNEIVGYNFYEVFLAAAVLILFVLLVVGCVCCPHNGIKALSHQNGIPITHHTSNSSCNLENASEFTIFPPPSAVTNQPTSHSLEDKVTFEPLPEIFPRRHTNSNSSLSLRPAHFGGLLKKKSSLHDWFDDPNSNFSRGKLQYLKEVGNGWFGRVVEGEAHGITTGQNITPVIVKILREEASPSEHIYFLHEMRPYRDLLHPNVIGLLGRCLESDPFLIIMEHTMMDLKSYLIDQRRKKSKTLHQDGILLKMTCNIVLGLQYLHESGFTHVDLAAHNCFVTMDLTVKIGDYGTSFETHKEDYYCLGDIALPLRWYSPETLHCTETTIETKEITKESNIWALGVVFWEIVEFGKLPYMDLTDDEVLHKVIIDKALQLEEPQSSCIHKEQLFQIMKLCWKSETDRPKVNKIAALLNHLYDNCDVPSDSESFEVRWNSLQSKIREHNLPQMQEISLKFENDFALGTELQSVCDVSISLSECDSNRREASILENSELMSHRTSLDSFLSPSLCVLTGSIGEISESFCMQTNSMSSSDTNSSFIHDAKTLNSCWPPPLKQTKSQNEGLKQEQISDATRDLDMVLTRQNVLCDNLQCTPEKQKKYVPSSINTQNVKSLHELTEYSVKNIHNHGLESEGEMFEIYCESPPCCVEDKSSTCMIESTDLEKIDGHLRMDGNYAAYMEYEDKKAHEKNSNIHSLNFAVTDNIHCEHKLENCFEAGKYLDEQEECLYQLNTSVKEQSIGSIDSLPQTTWQMATDHICILQNDKKSHINCMYQDKSNISVNSSHVEMKNSGQCAAAITNGKSQQGIKLDCVEQPSNVKHVDKSQVPIFIASNSPLYNHILLESDGISSKHSCKHQTESLLEYFQNPPNIEFNVTENSSFECKEFESAYEPELENIKHIDQESLSHTSDFYDCEEECIPTIEANVNISLLTSTPNKESCCSQMISSTQNNSSDLKSICSNYEEISVINNDTTDTFYETVLDTERSTTEVTAALNGILYEMKNDQSDNEVSEKINTIAAECIDSVKKYSEQTEKFKSEDLVQVPENASMNSRLYSGEVSNKNNLIQDDNKNSEIQNVSKPSNLYCESCVMSTSPPSVGVHSSVKKSITHSSEESENGSFITNSLTAMNDDLEVIEAVQDSNTMKNEPPAYSNNTSNLQDDDNVVDLLADGMLSKCIMSDQGNELISTNEETMQQLQRMETIIHKTNISNSAERNSTVFNNDEFESANSDSIEHSFVCQKSNLNVMKLNDINDSFEEMLSLQDSLLCEENYLSNHTTAKKRLSVEDNLKYGNQGSTATVNNSEQSCFHVESLSFEYLIENSMLDGTDSQKTDNLVQLESKSMCTKQFTETTDLLNEQYHSNNINILDEESSDNFTSVSSISDLQKGLIIEEKVCISPEKEVEIMSDKTEHIVNNEKSLSEIAGDVELPDEFRSSKEITSCTYNTLNSGHRYLNNEQDTVTVEDLETGQKLLIPSSEALCDPLDNDDVLRIDTETNEAILVDSSESLVGFVPSRSIELLQECPVIANVEDDSSEAQVCIQQQEVSHNSPASTSSAICSGSEDVFITEDEHSEAPESEPLGDLFEVSSLPVYEHLVEDNEENISYRIHDTSHCSFNVKEVTSEGQNLFNSKCEKTNKSNISFQDNSEDVMFCREPSKSVQWLSDETLDNIQNDSNTCIVIESDEILAGEDGNKMNIQTIASSLTVDNIKQIKENFPENDSSCSFFNQLETCFSPYGSTASSPCRDMVYTPDFESDTEESSGTSCSSTSGSFECIHNKFKNTTNISEIKDDRDECHQLNKHQVDSSPLQVFSKSWDRHATPTRSLLKTPEKKMLPMRKSVSFHEEDPPLIFQYPPASDSSEDEFLDEEEFSWHVDYTSYADWELQVGDDDEIPEDIVEVEELDSEPETKGSHCYRSISLHPLRSPMLYSLTGFSDEDLDLPEMTGSSQFSLLSYADEGNRTVLPESKENFFVHKMIESGQLSEKDTIESKQLAVKDTMEILDTEDLLIEEMQYVQPSVMEQFQSVISSDSDTKPENNSKYMKKNLIENNISNDEQAEECSINSEESCRYKAKGENEFQQSLKYLFDQKRDNFEIFQDDTADLFSEGSVNFSKMSLTLSSQDFHETQNINKHSRESIEDAETSDGRPQMIEIKSELNFSQIVESAGLISPVDPIHFAESKEDVDDATEYLEKYNFYTPLENKTAEVHKNADTQVKTTSTDSIVSALKEDPVPLGLSFTSNTTDMSNSHKLPNLFYKYSKDEIQDTKESIYTDSESSNNFYDKVVSISINRNVPCLVKPDSSKMSEFTMSDGKSNFSEFNTSHGTGNYISSSSSKLDTLINKNHQEIDNLKFIDNKNSPEQKKKVFETDNMPLQKNYKLGNDCPHKEKEQDSAISSGEESPTEFPVNTDILDSEGNLKKSEPHLLILKNQDTLNSKATALQNLQVNTNQKSLKIPLIIINDADEYSVDCEMEQFFNNQIKTYEDNEYINDFHSSEDFTVTSKFSYDPFEDTFGYFDGQASEDEDFVEAYNSLFNSWDIREFTEKSFDSNDLVCVNHASNNVAKNEALVRTERSSSLPLFSEALHEETRRAKRYGSLQEDLHCILNLSLDSSHVVTETCEKSAID